MTLVTSLMRTRQMQTKEFINKHLTVHNKSGDEWQCLCPFHDDTSPSFSINIRLGVYICFACGERGTMDRLSQHLGVTGPTAVKDEEQEIERLRSVITELDKSDRFLTDNYLGRFRNDHPYWEHERGFSPAVQQKFELGYDPVRDHGVIPLRNFRGLLMGVIRRQFAKDASPRYLYPRGFKISQHLFGAHLARTHGRIAIVEGSLDCVACWDVGIPAVALLGSKMSAHQYDLLVKIGADFMVVMTDRDEAGQKEAERLKDGFGQRLVVGTYDKSWVGKDPADLEPWQRRQMFDSALHTDTNS